MPPFSFLIKPASGACNMRCKYCFYENEMSLRQEEHPVFMTTDTAELLIKQAFSSMEAVGKKPLPPVSFVFQGGEPTLAGLEFFRTFMKLVQTYNVLNCPVQYSIQTNGLSLNEEWADFFAENRFLVGVSIDGDRALHESLRPDAAGNVTWDRVTGNLALLQSKQVETNLLCVVTKQCAKHPERYYRALKNLGCSFLQFIPCLDPLNASRGSMPYSLSPKLYGSFLCGLFDEWYWDWKSGHYTSIRLFDDYIHLALGMPASTCATSGRCGAYFVVEGDGTLYPCDFYCLNEWKIGKLGEAPLTEYAASPVEARFLEEGTRHPSECSACHFYPLCYGGCKRDWYTDAAGNNHNYFCSAFLQLFTYAEQRILEIARTEQQLISRHHTPINASKVPTIFNLP